MSGGVDETVDVKEVGNGAEENENANLNGESVEEEKKGTLPLSGDQVTQESIGNDEARAAGTDDKEVGNEADENGNANMNDESFEGEKKETLSPVPANQETQESTENGEVMTAGADNVVEDMADKTIVEAEKEEKEQNPEAEKIVEIHDVKSAEATGDAAAAKVNGTEENVNMEIDANGNHDDYSDVKFESDDNVAKENEEDEANVLKEGKVEDNGEDKDDKSEKELNDEATNMDQSNAQFEEELDEPKLDEEHDTVMNTPNKSFLDGYDSGTEEEQAEFAEEVKAFYRENNLEYKAPKFYKEDLNLLKLWRSVIKLGGYDQVSSCKLWRQVGESFRPPKTCTTVSWTFRIFYEKALLEYERHKMRNGELPFSDDSFIEPVRVDNQVPGSQALGSGRARRDAAARAMQGWHSQRLLGNGEVSEPIIKDKNLSSAVKGKTNGLLKRKKPSSVEPDVNAPHMKSMRMDSTVIDIGPPADWVKINVQKTSDCYEIYALVPGLLREEVHVQSDPAGRVVISGEPEKPDNPWGVTPFKKVVSLPTRIDPHQTSAVVTLHGQLFVRVPFEQLDS